jgi:SAM-dependent methyltransferase
MGISNTLERWVLDILADPLTKLPTSPEAIGMRNGTVDARRYLPHTIGFDIWSSGQTYYESWNRQTIEDYRAEIEHDAPVYDHIRMSGRIVDVGGGPGTVRHFLPDGVQFLSLDPFIDQWSAVPPEKMAAYPCLAKPLNFIAACAEFLPLQAHSFDWVHMRSMIDHVHSPDLALIEARRVLKPGGRLIIGLYVDGGRTGRRPLDRMIKELARPVLVAVGFRRFKDHHVFHPTLVGLQKLITDSGFSITDVYWQPAWRDQVCYISASPSI